MNNQLNQKMSTALRNLLDFELEANGWSIGEIREVRRYLEKGAANAHQRRLVQRYQTLRRNIIATEVANQAKHDELVKRYDIRVYTAAELDLIPHGDVREAAIELSEMWSVYVPGIDFPGVMHSVDTHKHDGSYDYYINGWNLPATLPQMYSTAGRLTRADDAQKFVPGHKGYGYKTIKVTSALKRFRNGQEIFAY